MTDSDAVVRPSEEEHHEAVGTTASAVASRLQLPAPELDLARLAATLRGVIPRVDEEARERLEAAWVSLTNAMKQPKTDAARLSRRVRRLRDELDQWVGRGGPATTESTPSDPDTGLAVEPARRSP